jgi:hypothetical protein
VTPSKEIDLAPDNGDNPALLTLMQEHPSFATLGILEPLPPRMSRCVTPNSSLSDLMAGKLSLPSCHRVASRAGCQVIRLWW